MIEVVFGESEGGAMKVAKNYKKPYDKKGPTAWFGKKPSKEEIDKMFEGEAVGGDSSEVVCIPFMLDIGDITLPVDSDYRKNLILDMYTINGWEDKSKAWAELEEAWGNYIGEIERLKFYAKQGEHIRLWYSDAPYSICGFYFVCNLLSHYTNKVSVIKLPQYIMQSDEVIQSYTSWNEIDAGKFYRFLNLEKELSSYELHFLATKWTHIMEEKSMLRAVVNGQLIGVPEDFYDHIIRSEFPEGEVIMARLIGDIIGNHPLAVGDWWYAKRILLMVDQGEIIIVKKDKQTYRQILKKV